MWMAENLRVARYLVDKTTKIYISLLGEAISQLHITTHYFRRHLSTPWIHHHAEVVEIEAYMLFYFVYLVFVGLVDYK